MATQKSNSLVNLGEISKPADTLIKKVSKAVGCIFAPYQIKRIAKAEAEASIIQAQSEITITDLHRRAVSRFIEEEAQKQENIEDITNRAISHLKENSDASNIEDDWVTNFFDKSRIVSDSEMKDLWARVLAGEANSPGTYSKRTVNFLGDLDKVDAELFANLCGFGWEIGPLVPLIFDIKEEIYNKHNVNFYNISHLESIGLVKFKDDSGFRLYPLPKYLKAIYFEKDYVLEMPNESNNELKIGKVMLTKMGEELSKICDRKKVNGFEGFVKEKWENYLQHNVS